MSRRRYFLQDAIHTRLEELGLTQTDEFRFEHNFVRLSPPFNTETMEKALEVLSRTAELFAATHAGVSRDAIFKSSEFRKLYFAELGQKAPRMTDNATGGSPSPAIAPQSPNVQA